MDATNNGETSPVFPRLLQLLPEVHRTLCRNKQAFNGVDQEGRTVCLDRRKEQGIRNAQREIHGGTCPHDARPYKTVYTGNGRIESCLWRESDAIQRRW